MARTAALVGIPVALVTGTPLAGVSLVLAWVAAVPEVLLPALVLHQPCTDLLRSAPAQDAETRTWAARLRTGAVVVGGVDVAVRRQRR